jgi:hypothetical protein
MASLQLEDSLHHARGVYLMHFHVFADIFEKRDGEFAAQMLPEFFEAG